MRQLLAIVVATVSACGHPAAPARMPIRVPPVPTLRLSPDAPAVVFDPPKGWSLSQDQGTPYQAILTRTARGDEAIALTLEPTGFDDTIETETTRWAMLAAGVLHAFTPTKLDDPVYASDEASSFLLHGVDGQGQPQALLCRVRHLGAATADYWLVLLATGPENDLASLKAAGDELSKSAHIHVSTPLK